MATLTEQNIEPNWSWNTKLCRTYTGAKYEYTNNDKNQTIKVEVGGGNRILKVTDAASNASEAERITLAKINEANKGDTTMSVTMTRANRKIIATLRDHKRLRKTGRQVLCGKGHMGYRKRM